MSKVITYLKTALLTIVVLICSLIFANLVILSYFLSFFLNKTKRNSVAHFFSSLWGKSIIWLTPGWKVKIEGKENFDKNQRYVFVANHESATDIFVMYFTNLQFRWLSKASIFKIPFIGHAMKYSGYIPVDRGNRGSHRKALESSVQTVKSGIPMLYFPEGTRSRTGDLNSFKVGAFKLAADTDAKILPICLVGTKDLLQKGSMVPGKANVTVKILEPTDQNAGESLEDYAARVRDIISQHR
jgi:1-acyl-sn-glycerol-3-phosphate acyltransferase